MNWDQPPAHFRASHLKPAFQISDQCIFASSNEATHAKTRCCYFCNFCLPGWESISSDRISESDWQASFQTSLNNACAITSILKAFHTMIENLDWKVEEEIFSNGFSLQRSLKMGPCNSRERTYPGIPWDRVWTPQQGRWLCGKGPLEVCFSLLAMDFLGAI